MSIMDKQDFIFDLIRAMGALKKAESIPVRMKRHSILLTMLDGYMQFPDWDIDVASDILHVLSESHDILRAYLDERWL